MPRDFFGNPDPFDAADPFDRLSGQTPEEQLADQELLINEIDNALNRTRNLIQDVRDRGGVLTEEARYWRGGAERAKSVDLAQLHDTYDEQLADRDREAKKLQQMQTWYDEATRPPTGLNRADFIDEWGATLGLDRPYRDRY